MLLQQIYSTDPWKLLVGCILLNQTTRTQVDRVRGPLFDKYPSPVKLGEATQDVLAELIAPCGLQHTRAKRLIDFSRAWVKLFDHPQSVGFGLPTREQVEALPGCGAYAGDSYAFFVLRDYGSFKSGDKELAKWIEDTGIVIPPKPDDAKVSWDA